MINGVQTSGLSQIFNRQTNQYSRVLEQIASGHRFTRPSDDFASFVRTRTLQSGLGDIHLQNQELAAARETATNAAGLGNAVFEAITELRELSEAHNRAEAEDKANILADFNGRVNALVQLLAGNSNGGFKATVGGIGDNSANNFELDLSAIDIDALRDVTTNPSTPAPLTNMPSTSTIDSLLNNVATYTAEANAFNSLIDRQLTINENMIAAREQTISAVRDIDDMRTIQEATMLEIRRNASVSMMAQANISQGVIARLFA
jgi:flagellin-like hook-associated protein FlgL